MDRLTLGYEVYSKCDRCGSVTENDDLNEWLDELICDNCLELAKFAKKMDAENEHELRDQCLEQMDLRHGGV